MVIQINMPHSQNRKAIDKTEKLSIEQNRIERLPIDQNGYQKNRIAIDRTEIENI